MGDFAMPKIQKQLETIREQCGSVDAYIAREFGPEVRFSVVGDFCLVHLDNPPDEEITRRENEFDPNHHFPDDCPICEMQKEMGGFIVYDGVTGSEPTVDEDEPREQDAPETIARALEWPEDRLWRRSYINMRSYREASPDIRVNMIFMHLWANVVELREDLGAEGAAVLEVFSRELKGFLRPVQILLAAPDAIIPWRDISGAFELAKEKADGITAPSFEHKLNDFRQTLNLLGESIRELIAHRSLMRN